MRRGCPDELLLEEYIIQILATQLSKKSLIFLELEVLLSVRFKSNVYHTICGSPFAPSSGERLCEWDLDAKGRCIRKADH